MDRFKVTKRAGVLGIVGNIFLLAIKGTIGFISKSQAMIADAANSAGDIFASFMTFIGNKIASAPKDEDHNFGHGKAEYIFSMLIALSMIVISLKIVYDSICSIIYDQRITFSWWLVGVCIATIVTKLSLFIYTRYAYKKCHNLLLKANMEDHRNDCIVTSFTTLSIILSKFGVRYVDGIVGIGISCWILFTGVKIFLESYNVLMDKSMDEDLKKSIISKVNEYDEVLGIKEIYSIPTGYRFVVVLTIYLNGTLTTFTSHEIADKIQDGIAKTFDEIDEVIVHVEPKKKN